MTGKMAVCCNKLKEMTSVTHKKLMRQVYFAVKPARSLTFMQIPAHWCKKQATTFLACSAWQ